MALRDTLRVMIVDDMGISRALLTQSVEEMGVLGVTDENSGDIAFPKLAANPVHLVISDYNMPGMSGLDLLENLRMNQTTRSIGFILVTGSPNQEMLERGQKLGLNNLVKKPFTTQSLKAAVEAVVGHL
jgi:two-component system chemotaxis response regulator CheY